MSGFDSKRQMAQDKVAQPAQEPVACVQDLDEVKRKHLVYQKGMDWKDPLYTTPPQRPWVGLTKDQFLEAARLAEDGNYLVAFQRIQQWLQEANT